MKSDEEFVRKLERKGEAGVRDDLANQRYTDQRARIARDYLERIDREREGELRDAEVNAAKTANVLASQANEHARKANWIAGGAFVVAVIALLVSLFNLSR